MNNDKKQWQQTAINNNGKDQQQWHTTTPENTQTRYNRERFTQRDTRQDPPSHRRKPAQGNGSTQRKILTQRNTDKSNVNAYSTKPCGWTSPNANTPDTTHTYATHTDATLTNSSIACFTHGLIKQITGLFVTWPNDQAVRTTTGTKWLQRDQQEPFAPSGYSSAISTAARRAHQHHADWKSWSLTDPPIAPVDLTTLSEP